MELGAGSAILQLSVATAVDATSDALSQLESSGLTPANNRDAITVIREVEILRRRIDAITVDLVAQIDENCFFAADGHASGKAMYAHYANLSGAESAARSKTGKVMAALPDVAAAYRAGKISTDHMRVLGRVHANPRVRDKMREDQHWFLNRATRLSFTAFEVAACKWMDLADSDGPDPAAERSHELRNANLTQDFDKSWTLIGGFAAGQGAALAEVFEKYIDAETKADWEKARAEFGDAATYNDLPRSIQQRRADALWQLFQDAAASPHGAVPPDFVHNIMWDQETFEEMARRIQDDQEGTVTDAADPEPLDPDVFVCQTIDGVQLDPYEAFASALNSRIRRVLVDAAGVVVDLGEARFFTGLARHAVKLAFTECVWVGCHVPTSQCEADHLIEHSRYGRTNPGNGAPLCGRHNRWKQKGFSIYRDPAGGWHLYRPDGSEVPAQ